VRSGVVFIPLLGFHSFQNDDATSLGAGLRLGALLGGRVNHALSLNVEATFDVLNPKNVPSSVDVTALQFHAAFSPLLHTVSGTVEFVAGPKLGVFALTEDASGGGLTASSSAHGWLYGFNVGLFGAVNEKVSIGGLISFDFEKATEACVTNTTHAETCTTSGLDNSAKVLAVAIALLI
jgi:hypothetical protein